jgi:carbonic anhydrase/acetyltransferase-like protein (isoleucine patch superfamily)
VIISYHGRSPKIHESVYIAEGARIIGDVKIGEDSSVWFNTVVRVDVTYVRIGERTNVPRHFEVPEGMLVAGVPVRIKREITDEERRQIVQSAQHYVDYARTYLE